MNTVSFMSFSYYQKHFVGVRTDLFSKDIVALPAALPRKGRHNLSSCGWTLFWHYLFYLLFKLCIATWEQGSHTKLWYFLWFSAVFGFNGMTVYIFRAFVLPPPRRLQIKSIFHAWKYGHISRCEIDYWPLLKNNNSLYQSWVQTTELKMMERSLTSLYCISAIAYAT